MLLLMFRVANEWYAVDAGRVREVVPRVALKAIPHAPAHLGGLFDYRGKAVPVVDLGQLLAGDACRSRLSTRIILIDVFPKATEPPARQTLGLIAEQVLDVRATRAADVALASTSLEHAPYLGAIVRVDAALVQMIEADRIPIGARRDSVVSHVTEGR